MPETRVAHTRTVDLSASDVLASLAGIQMSQGPYAGQVSVFVTISDASGTPNGEFDLYASGDGENYVQVTSTAVDQELLSVAPAGAELAGVATFENFPGLYLKVRYVRTSGSGSAILTVVC